MPLTIQSACPDLDASVGSDCLNSRIIVPGKMIQLLAIYITGGRTRLCCPYRYPLVGVVLVRFIAPLTSKDGVALSLFAICA